MIFADGLPTKMQKMLLPTDLSTSTSYCQPSSFQVNKKMSRENSTHQV